MGVTEEGGIVFVECYGRKGKGHLISIAFYSSYQDNGTLKLST